MLLSVAPALADKVTRCGAVDYERDAGCSGLERHEANLHPDLMVQVRNENDVVKAIGFAKSLAIEGRDPGRRPQVVRPAAAAETNRTFAPSHRRSGIRQNGR
jgi:hypothetical protein